MVDESYKKLSTLLVIVIIVGLIGNVLNLAVFGRKNLRKMPTFRFLFYLSLIDIFILLICATNSVLTYGYNIEIRLYSRLACKFHTFFAYLLTHLGSVVLMCISVERAMVVCNINLVKFHVELKMLRIYRVEKVIVFILIVLVSINLHHLFYFDLNIFNQNLNNQMTKIEIKDKIQGKEWSVPNNLTLNEILDYEHEDFSDVFDERLRKRDLSEEEDEYDFKGEILICYPLQENNYHYFLDHIWTWIDSAIYCFVPFFVMTICSIVIYFELKRTSNRLLKITARTNKKFVQKRMKRNKQIFYLLTSTNLFFILCSLPYCILSFKSNDESTFSNLTKTLLIIHIFSYSNNSFNFIYYGLFSKQYRDSVIKLLRFCYIGNMINQNDDMNAYTTSNRYRTDLY
jgi:hypothetical protein